MAAAAAKTKYGQGAVYGSLAYDFNHPELYQDEYGAAPERVARPTPRTQTQTRTKVHTRAKTAVHTRQSIAPMSVVGVAVAAFLFVIAIMAQAQLVGISAESVSLQNELTQLEEQQAKLRIRYESAFNMSDIEEYATKSIGMQKPHADQIFYIDTSAPDKAVVIADSGETGFVDKVSDFISGFGAYFH